MSGSSDTKISTLPAVSVIADGDIWPVVQGTGIAAETRRAATTVLRQAMQKLAAPALTGAVARTVQDRLDDGPNLRDFGSVGGGDNDDTAVFNKLFNCLRGEILSDSAYVLPFSATIPPGLYRVSSVNATGIVARQVHIDCAGAVLLSGTAGKAVIDGLSSRWLHLHDLTIYGDPAAPPRCGVQLGPAGTETCGNSALHNCMLIGDFAKAPYLNLGSETTALVSCTFENRLIDPSAYAAIYDGQSVYLPESDYVAITRTAGQAVSFTNNTAINTQFRNAGGGSAIYLAKTEGFTFDNGCYFVSVNDAAFVVYSGAPYRNKGLVANGQFENTQNDNPTPGNTGIKYAFKFIGDGTSTALEGLTVDTFGAQCEEALIYNAQSSALRLSNVRIRLANLSGGDSVPTMFLGSNLSVDGSITIQDAAKVNLQDLVGFSGDIHVNDATLLPGAPPTGAYRVTDRTNKTMSLFGTVSVINPASSSAQVLFGNSAQNLIALQGSSTAPTVRAVGAATDINLALLAKGTGYVRSVSPLQLFDGVNPQPLYVGTSIRIEASGAPVFPLYSATQLGDATHAVNTSNKRNGTTVRDTTNNRLMVASGALATSAWYVADGSASITPA